MITDNDQNYVSPVHSRLRLYQNPVRHNWSICDSCRYWWYQGDMVGEERDPRYMLTKRKAVYWEQINRIGRRMAKRVELVLEPTLPGYASRRETCDMYENTYYSFLPAAALCFSPSEGLVRDYREISQSCWKGLLLSLSSEDFTSWWEPHYLLQPIGNKGQEAFLQWLSKVAYFGRTAIHVVTSL